jgi:hypothetical protein
MVDLSRVVSIRCSDFVRAAAFAAAVGSGAVAATQNDHVLIEVPRERATKLAPKPAPKFRMMFGEPARWPGPLRWRYNHGDAPKPLDSDPSGTLAQIQAGIDAWTQVCGITFVYEGETTIRPNTVVRNASREEPDGVNVVGWGEPGSNAAGVAWVSYDDDGTNRALIDADIMFSPRRIHGGAEVARIGMHEWGHALGLSHSNLQDTMMSGPPESAYNGLTGLQADDVRGCRCLYGPPAGQQAAYSCSLPERVEFRDVPVGGESAAETVTLTNHGNAPLAVTSVAPSSGSIVVKANGCTPGTALATGQSCVVSIAAFPIVAGHYGERLTFQTGDGAYDVPVTFTGMAGGPGPGPVTPRATANLVEYHHEAFDHYFVTHLEGEIAKLDDGTLTGWKRTGRTIRVWTSPAEGSAPVCRFYSASFAPKSSHFYTAYSHECSIVKSSPLWQFEGEVFHVATPDVGGNCAPGTVRLYRLYNDGKSGAPNHRFTLDAALRAQMIARGWVPEGFGPGVTMCTPSS